MEHSRAVSVVELFDFGSEQWPAASRFNGLVFFLPLLSCLNLGNAKTCPGTVTSLTGPAGGIDSASKATCESRDSRTSGPTRVNTAVGSFGFNYFVECPTNFCKCFIRLVFFVSMLEVCGSLFACERTV